MIDSAQLAPQRQLQLGKLEKTTPKQPGVNRAEQRRVIDGAVGELIVLLSQKASHSILTEKLEALHQHIQALFPPAGTESA